MQWTRIRATAICEIASGGPCTLRGAIQEANALANSGGPDRIELPAGIFTLSLEGIDEAQALSGDLDITDDVILQGAGASETIIDAAAIDRVIDIVRGTVVINDVTIRGGAIEDEDVVSIENSGGGIRNEDILTIARSTVTGNIASAGAGIANYNGTLRIVQSVISGNGDEGTMRGGGIANDSNYDAASLEVTDSTISGNRAIDGAGISNHSYDGMASATIERSTLSGNTTQNGGAIANRSIVSYADTAASNLFIRGSTVSGNTADDSGGGIHNEADDGSVASAEIANSTITANVASAGDGGGIRDVAPAGGSTMLRSVILFGNTAGGEGPDLSSDRANAMFSLIGDESGHTVDRRRRLQSRRTRPVARDRSRTTVDSH